MVWKFEQECILLRSLLNHKNTFLIRNIIMKCMIFQKPNKQKTTCVFFELSPNTFQPSKNNF